MKASPRWTKEMEYTLAHLWQPGNSARYIAQVFTQRFERFFSKSAIIGKASRMGLDTKDGLKKRMAEAFKQRLLRAKAMPKMATCRYCTYPPVNGAELCLGCMRAAARGRTDGQQIAR